MSTSTAAAAPPTKDDPTIWEVDDALWAELQPLLGNHHKPGGGANTGSD